jgi:hypothetical protein
MTTHSGGTHKFAANLRDGKGKPRCSGKTKLTYSIETIFRDGPSNIVRSLERILDTESIPVSCILIQTSYIDLQSHPSV